MDNEQKKKSAFADEWWGAGIALGVAFGIIFENLALWLPIGVCLGFGLSEWKERKSKKNNNPNDTTDKE